MLSNVLIKDRGILNCWVGFWGGFRYRNDDLYTVVGGMITVFETVWCVVSKLYSGNLCEVREWFWPCFTCFGPVLCSFRVLTVLGRNCAFFYSWYWYASE